MRQQQITVFRLGLTAIEVVKFDNRCFLASFLDITIFFFVGEKIHQVLKSLSRRMIIREIHLHILDVVIRTLAGIDAGRRVMLRTLAAQLVCPRQLQRRIRYSRISIRIGRENTHRAPCWAGAFERIADTVTVFPWCNRAVPGVIIHIVKRHRRRRAVVGADMRLHTL